MRVYQRCQNAGGWTVVAIESSRDPNTVYKVVIGDYDYICDCKGFEFNGHCKHRDMAEMQRCRWEEGKAPNQTAAERKLHICPVCGSHTDVIAEKDDE